MLHIHLFGHLKIVHGDQPVRFSALPKTLPLWVYLLLHRNRALAREPLAFLLWPDVGEAEARGNLRRHLHDLKRALPPAPQEMPWLLLDATSVQWNPDAPYWLDVQEFEAAAALPARWAEAAALYTGDLLPAIYDDWAMFERERLRNRFLDVLSQLMQQHHSHGELSQAITCAQQMLAYDPMREDVVRELMSLRFEAGDRPGALLEYQRFEQRLRAAAPSRGRRWGGGGRRWSRPPPSTTPSPATSPHRPTHNRPARQFCLCLTLHRSQQPPSSNRLSPTTRLCTPTCQRS